MVGYSMAWYWRDMAIVPDTGRVNVFLEQRGDSCASWMRHICFPINVACNLCRIHILIISIDQHCSLCRIDMVIIRDFNDVSLPSHFNQIDELG